MGRRAARWGVVPGCGLAVALLTGCASTTEEHDVVATADAFTAAAPTDPSAACGRLAPLTVEDLVADGEACPVALADAGLVAPGRRLLVTVAGQSAQVRYAADTVFLARFADGWRVTAAGCRHRSADPAVPYDCRVEGG